jgi:hypothetical protein
VPEIKGRLEKAKIAAPQLTPEWREQLLKLANEREKIWGHLNSLVTRAHLRQALP